MIAKDNSRASESGHWYDRATGTPRYSVLGKNGKERNTTLRDAKAGNDLVPSVTTVIRVAASPGLEAWKQQQVLMASLTLPRAENEEESVWIERIMMDSKETGKKAAERGTAIHAGVQAHYEGKEAGLYLPHAIATEKAVLAYFGEKKWQPEVSFSFGGFGGKCDLMARPNGTDAGLVIDVKTKDFSDPDKVVAFDEHLMQLSAYRMGFEMPRARCANVFVSVKEPVQIKVVEWSDEDLQRGWAMFSSLLNYWQIKNNYR